MNGIRGSERGELLGVAHARDVVEDSLPQSVLQLVCLRH